MYYDYHMHSNFSADSQTDMEDMVKKSIDLGLKEICFTDHVDYDVISDIEF
ncbi:MAG: PHP domain-containing protein, partial [Paeniclostridium sordellii]|nr:PHP domain-containing protein [Paeniclostridium sordellii]